MAQTETKINQEKITKIIQEIRDILAPVKTESEAISKIMVYAQENGLRYVGLDFNCRTGSATFKVTFKKLRHEPIKLKAKFPTP